MKLGLLVTRALEDQLAFPDLQVRRDPKDRLESQGTKETKVTAGSRDHREQWVKKARMVCRGLMGRTAHLAFLESRALLVRLADLGHLVPMELQGYLGVRAQRVNQVTRERQDLEVTLAWLAPPDHWVSLVFLERLAWTEFLGQRVIEARGELLVQRDL